MNPRRIVTAFLLAFVAINVAALLRDALRQPRPMASAAEAPAASPGARHLIAYYFHGNARCRTCLSIESFSKEAILQGFPEEVRSGRIEWRTANVDDPANEHFVQDFQLTTRSLVLVETEGGSRVSWRNLALVWDLAPDKDAFLRYVRDTTRLFLEGKIQ